MIETLNYAGVPLDKALEREPDLDKIKAALIREYWIRRVMTDTGEDRQTVIDGIGAVESMDQEAVLDLTSGAPTTLADGLQALIETLDEQVMYGGSEVIDTLHALLTYPWPEEEATIATHGANAAVGLRVDMDANTLTVYVGGQKIHVANHEENTLPAAADVAEAVHRAVLARVIGDRPHHVQLSSSERMALIQFLDWPNGGSISIGKRLSVNAVEGEVVLIQTQPHTYVTPPATRSPRRD